MYCYRQCSTTKQRDSAMMDLETGEEMCESSAYSTTQKLEHLQWFYTWTGKNNLMHFSLALCIADIFWLYRGLLIKLSWAYMVLLCYIEGQKKPNQTKPYLREIEQCWFTEEYISQVNRPTGQHLNLVFTEMVTSQKFTKVPAHVQRY